MGRMKESHLQLKSVHFGVQQIFDRGERQPVVIADPVPAGTCRIAFWAGSGEAGRLHDF